MTVDNIKKHLIHVKLVEDFPSAYRINPKDYIILNAMCKLEGCNRSEMIRQLIRDGGEARGIYAAEIKLDDEIHTCKNCKWYDRVLCASDNTPVYAIRYGEAEIFGCNKWEAK